MGNPDTADIDLMQEECAQLKRKSADAETIGFDKVVTTVESPSLFGADPEASGAANHDSYNEEFDREETVADGGDAPVEAVHEDPGIATTKVIEETLQRVAQGDCGAPFEEVALNVFLALRDKNYPQWMRVRAQLKRAHRDVSVPKLDKAIAHLSRSLKEIAPTHYSYANDVWRKMQVAGHFPVAVQGVLYQPQASSQLWEELSFGQLQTKIAEEHDGKANCFRQEDYFSIAKVVLSIAEKPSFFEDAPEGVACLRSFYKVANGTILKEALGLGHRQMRVLDFEPENIPTPLYDAFRAETFQSPTEGDEADQTRLLDEFAGASMLGIGHRYQKAFVWTDPYGRAGKGAMQEILGRLVHPDLTSAVSPLLWGRGNEYYIASLASMRLNVVGELPENAVIPAAEFKSVLGGDLLTGRMPTQPPFAFRNRATHLLMTNHAIKSNEHSEAFYARWKLMEFPNSRLKSGKPLDPSLARNIVDHELPGIAYKALEGARRLLSQNGFSESQVHDRLMAKWRVSANSVQEFVNEMCELGDDKLRIRRSAFYKTYVQWCKDNGRAASANGRVKDMLTHNLQMGIRASVLDGHEVYRGIRLKPEMAPAFNSDLDRVDDLAQDSTPPQATPDATQAPVDF